MAAALSTLAGDIAGQAGLATVLTATAGDLQPATGGGCAASAQLPNGADVTALATLLHHRS